MALSEEEKIVIKNLVNRGYKVHQILQHSDNTLRKSTVYDFVKKLRETGSIQRREGSGRPKTVRTEDNIALIRNLASVSPERRPNCVVSTKIGAMFIFPREENKRLGTNPPCHNNLPIVEEIKIIMENAKHDAINCAKDLNMLLPDELIKSALETISLPPIGV
ncbi:unnamed protein product [Ceutorhynchus assimilis]|uniref:Uncharacterized protein n=1 Tax=Ceutorhynchus assimilis TaxID=467358 RepID=A0A9N9MGJ6_9CUCU|nr:unnamed protein product [Ceutorhynchus assimilis]